MTASSTSTRQAREARRTGGERGGRDDVRRPVDELAGFVRPPCDDLGACGDLRVTRVGAADDEALQCARTGVAPPSPGVVAPEDRTFHDRLHLAVLGHRQRVVDHPRDRADAAVRAHHPSGGRAQVLRVEPVGRDECDAPRPHLVPHVHDGDAIRLGRRARQPPFEERVEPADAEAACGEREDVRLDLGGLRGRELDVHLTGQAIGVSRSARVIACFYHHAVRVRVLGSAAGGGFPQWNCRCPTCEAARTGTAARPRTPSSIAVRGAAGPWFLVNASPDLHRQLEGLAADRADGVRVAPVAAVLLDGRGDRPHGGPVAPARVRGAHPRVRQRRGSPRADRRLPGPANARRVLRRAMADDRARAPVPLDGSSLEVEPFAAGGDAPRYVSRSGAEIEASGLVFRDRSTGGVLTYVPGLARLDGEALGRLAASDVVLVDGTFWRDDELVRLGISGRTARQMGHVPLSGPGGSLEALAQLERPRVVLVHVNNTNPVLLERSPERDAVLRAGAEVAHDGLEVEL